MKSRILSPQRLTDPTPWVKIWKFRSPPWWWSPSRRPRWWRSSADGKGGFREPLRQGSDKHMRNWSGTKYYSFYFIKKFFQSNFLMFCKLITKCRCFGTFFSCGVQRDSELKCFLPIHCCHSSLIQNTCVSLVIFYFNEKQFCPKESESFTLLDAKCRNSFTVSFFVYFW